ncbi:MAG TPA: hypothetical protein VFV68_09720 [Agriterribacter sp.]|nr:hypothetical protein [Agriterribacter sp.]
MEQITGKNVIDGSMSNLLLPYEHTGNISWIMIHPVYNPYAAAGLLYIFSVAWQACYLFSVALLYYPGFI